MPLTHVSSRGLPVRLEQEDAEEVREREADQQVGRPAVDVANQPAELHLRDDELDALVGFGGARPVVEQQQDAGEHLDAEQEQRHPAEVVPDFLRVDRHAFLGDEVPHAAQIEPLVEPGDESCTMSITVMFATRRSPLVAGSPRRLTTNCSRPRGGGPETTLPPRSYVPLWQAHQSCEVSGLNCTVHSRCVHTALNARTSPSAVRTSDARTAAELENHRRVRLAARRLCRRATLAVAGSPLAGGTRKRETG